MLTKKSHCTKQFSFFVILLLLSLSTIAMAAPVKTQSNDDDWDECKTELKLGSLWTK